MSLQVNNVSNVNLPYATSLLEVIKKVSPDLEEAGKILMEGNKCVTSLDNAELSKYRHFSLDVRFKGNSKDSFEKGLLEIVVAQIIHIKPLAQIVVDYASPFERISMFYDGSRHKKLNANPCYKISFFNFYLVELPDNGNVRLQKGSEAKGRIIKSDSLILDTRNRYVVFHPNLELSIELSRQ